MRKFLLIALLAALAPSVALAQTPLPNPLVLPPNTIVGRGNLGTGYGYAMTMQEFVATLAQVGLSTTSGTAGGDLSGTYPNPTVAKINGTPPPNSGLFKGNGSGGIVAATSGSDYAPATSGSSVLKANGAGGFSSAVSGTDYAPATSGTAILKGNGTGGFANTVSGTDYAPATSGTAILKGNNAGGFAAAVSGTDYGTVSSVTCGTGLTGGTITTTGTCAINTPAQTMGTNLNPAATTSTTGVMMGMGTTCKITPVYSSRVLIAFTGNITNSSGTAPNITEVIAKFGTGTAPANGAAFTGTTIGSAKDYQPSTANFLTIFHHEGIVTGLTPGTAYWFDIDTLVSGGTGTISKVDCIVMEF